MQNTDSTSISIYNAAVELCLFDKNHALLIFYRLFSADGEITTSDDLLDTFLHDFSNDEHQTFEEALVTYLALLEDALSEIQNTVEEMKSPPPAIKNNKGISKKMLLDIREIICRLRGVDASHELLKFSVLTNKEQAVSCDEELLTEFSQQFTPESGDDGPIEDLFIEYFAALEDALEEETSEKEGPKAHAAKVSENV